MYCTSCMVHGTVVRARKHQYSHTPDTHLKSCSFLTPAFPVPCATPNFVRSIGR